MPEEPRGDEQPRRRWRRIVAIGLLLPLVAASLLIWSTNGRSARVDRIPVAIVNNDTIITSPQKMAAGRSLTAALTHPKKPQQNLAWTLSDKADADAGLRDGSYYAVLTIPSDFSSAILSSGTDKPVHGQLSLVSNGAASTTVPYISRQIAAAAGNSLGDQTTQGYLKNVYGGFNTLASNSNKAADSASQLAGGTDQLASGATKLDQGASSLASSLGTLSSGAGTLASGTQSVSSGAAKVSGGASKLANGAAKLHSSAKKVAGASTSLAGKSSRLAGASRTVARGATVVRVGTRGISAGQRFLTARLAGLRADCRSAGGSVAFCVRLSRVHAQSSRLAGASGRLHNVASRVSSGSHQVAGGADRLAGGAHKIASANRKLASASGTLSSSARTLRSGAASVASGAAGVVDGADQLASGSRSAASAGDSVASGSSTVASSAGKTDDGAQQLSTGLTKQAKQSPTYSSKQQDALAPVVSEPVELTSTVQHTGHGNGWLVAVILAIILWLAVLVAALGLDVAGVRRNALAPVTSRRLAVSQALPVIGFAALQAVALVLAVVVFHPSTAAIVPLVALVLLASVSFSMLALGLRVALGRAGVAIFVLLLVVQLAASGNVIPIETAPALLQRLNGILPMTAFVDGASQLVSGGQAASYAAVVVVLVVWAAVAAVLLVTGIKRRRSGVAAARLLVPAG